MNLLAKVVSLCVLSGAVTSFAPVRVVSDDRHDTVLLRKDISGYANRDMVLTVREIVIPPGTMGQKHRHPGPVVVYVVDGDLEIQLEGQPPRVYHRGETFSEDAKQLHLSSRNTSATAPVRLLSYILSRSGEALSQPEK